MFVAPSTSLRTHSFVVKASAHDPRSLDVR